jgi:hypothetical protein
MKDIMECTDDYLMLELPINKAVRVDLTYQPEETISHVDEQYPYVEYVTKASLGYQKLLNFINNTEGECIIHGNCPNCKEATYYKVGRGYELDKEILSLVLRSYVDEQIDCKDAYIPDPDFEMRNKAETLVRKVKFFDKKFQCPKCKEVYRASFALEYHEKLIEDVYGCEILLIKIGQYPSLQEFAIIDFKGFNKALDALKIKNDYRNAIRNHIDGDNIAAYVYLRRIVENIIMDSYRDNKKKLNIGDNEFEKLRTKEKISTLKDYLPKFLYNNKEIYSVVSAGIHTLTEQQCEKYYDTIKDAIDIILHQEEARRKELNLMKKTTRGIQSAVSEIES